MTKELEQKAKDYANDWLWFVKGLEIEHKTDPKPEYIRIEEAYIAGAVENGIKWHDLWKDPNDLPKGHKVVLNQVGELTTYDPDRGFLGFGGCGIRAWTDVPLFKE